MRSLGKSSAQELKLLLEKARQERVDVSIIERLKVFLYFAERGKSVSATCRHFGISRSTFHRWMERFDPRDIRSLQDQTTQPQYAQRAALSDEIIELIGRYRMRSPHIHKNQISELLEHEHGVKVPPASIGHIIQDKCFYFADTPLHWKKRMTHHRETERQTSGVSGASEAVPLVQKSLLGKETPVPVDIAPPAPDAQVSKAGVFWRSIRRQFIVPSIVTAIAFVTMLLGTELWEWEEAVQKNIQAMPTLGESASVASVPRYDVGTYQRHISVPFAFLPRMSVETHVAWSCRIIYCSKTRALI